MTVIGSEMSAADVLQVLHALEEDGVEVWLDGGWGVDALLGEQTRAHADVDLALDRESLAQAQRTLAQLGFSEDSTATPGLPARLVMTDPRGRQVDLHPLVFDQTQNGWQQLSADPATWGRYPADDLNARGVVAGHTVRCLSPALQLRFHLGYEWSERDRHDLRHLQQRFGVGPQLPALDQHRSL